MAARISKSVTVLDVMLLVAALALGFGLIRLEAGMGFLEHSRTWWHWTDKLGAAIVPLTAGLAVVGLRRSWWAAPGTPPGPGTLCCVAVTSLWMTNIVRETDTLWRLVRALNASPTEDFYVTLYGRSFLNNVIRPEAPAGVVVATTIVLALAGRWTFRRDATEVAGLVVAALWVIIGLPGTIIRHWD